MSPNIEVRGGLEEVKRWDRKTAQYEVEERMKNESKSVHPGMAELVMRPGSLQ